MVDVQHVDFILTFYLEGFCLFDDFTFVFDILLLFLMGFALEIKDEFFIGLGVDVRELVEDFLLDGFFTGGGLWLHGNELFGGELSTVEEFF